MYCFKPDIAPVTASMAYSAITTPTACVTAIVGIHTLFKLPVMMRLGRNGPTYDNRAPACIPPKSRLREECPPQGRESGFVAVRGLKLPGALRGVHVVWLNNHISRKRQICCWWSPVRAEETAILSLQDDRQVVLSSPNCRRKKPVTCRKPTGPLNMR